MKTVHVTVTHDSAITNIGISLCFSMCNEFSQIFQLCQFVMVRRSRHLSVLRFCLLCFSKYICTVFFCRRTHYLCQFQTGTHSHTGLFHNKSSILLIVPYNCDAADIWPHILKLTVFTFFFCVGKFPECSAGPCHTRDSPALSELDSFRLYL